MNDTLEPKRKADIIVKPYKVDRFPPFANGDEVLPYVYEVIADKEVLDSIGKLEYIEAVQVHSKCRAIVKISELYDEQEVVHCLENYCTPGWIVLLERALCK